MSIARNMLGLAFCLLSACAPSFDPAPEDLKPLLAWHWISYADASLEERADALWKLHKAGEVEDRSAPRKGQLPPLTLEELGAVELERSVDPSTANGMFLLNVFPGTFEQLN